MFIVGAGGIGMAVTANTTIQMAVPDQLRGRVMSVYTTVFAGSVPAGGLLMGAIASAWGVPLALMIGAVLSLAVGIGAWFWLSRIRGSQGSRVIRPTLVEAADIGAIDPEGRSAGPSAGSSAEPQVRVASRRSAEASRAPVAAGSAAEPPNRPHLAKLQPPQP
jgi:MFS family permease